MINTANQSLLGKDSPYCSVYNPDLLFSIPRQEKRDELGFDLETLPFLGADVWTAYEVSWLNLKGKPNAMVAEFTFSARSPFLVESKSFKLYLNSFNGSRFESAEQVKDLMINDLSRCAGEPVLIEFMALDNAILSVNALPGNNIDDLDIEIDEYTVNASLLGIDNSAKVVEETLNSHLLKSNCLVTSQPDWGSVVIHYVGKPIEHEGLLKYLISFREHNEFHEQCVERIFTDLMAHCQPQKLTVYARYVRRGGLDINPFRSNFEAPYLMPRLSRQ